uniref:Transient receptor potential cation channel subfamily M member 1-like n=1 Tax=Saccoglossus kowalevskii TaxID=10224 RepID=A0ABM0MUD8_SACKO|nr:PREDICTED: transient receptor potential cation channel subfamily M member 1-like [Saccoglossus kowalevskii]
MVILVSAATWGIVDNKDALDGNKNKHLWPAYYPAKDLKGGRNTAALDSNHTHFILVDNGTCGKYGADIELRAALEKYIADEKFISDKQVGDMEDKHCERVPVVLVVVEGGPNTLKTVYESTEKNMPAVIVEGSGRAADIIAYAYKKTKPTDGSDSNISKDVDREDIRRRIVRAFKLRINDETQKTVEEYIDWVESCISRRNLITVFRIQDADHRDIDGTILYALLKARSGSVQTQLNLALAWNRADISRQEIFAPERRMEWQTLYNPQNSPEEASVMTVELVKVQIALRKQRMMWPTKDQWNRYLLPLVGSLLTRLMGDEYPLNYSSDIFVVDPSGPRTQHEHHEDKSLSRERDEFKFEYAEKELFLWAVLMNRREMSRLFWQWGSSHIGGALVAGKLLRALSKIAAAEEELELSQDLRNHSMEYQLLGRDVLTECYNRDKKKSQLLVVRELPHWGHTTCMSIADSASQMEFMDHSLSK